MQQPTSKQCTCTCVQSHVYCSTKYGLAFWPRLMAWIPTPGCGVWAQYIGIGSEFAINFKTLMQALHPNRRTHDLLSYTPTVATGKKIVDLQLRHG